jgi:hypothetical protein
MTKTIILKDTKADCIKNAEKLLKKVVNQYKRTQVEFRKERECQP